MFVASVKQILHPGTRSLPMENNEMEDSRNTHSLAPKGRHQRPTFPTRLQKSTPREILHESQLFMGNIPSAWRAWHVTWKPCLRPVPKSALYVSRLHIANLSSSHCGNLNEPSLSNPTKMRSSPPQSILMHDTAPGTYRPI